MDLILIRIIQITSLILCILWSIEGRTLSTDREQPIQIQADRATIDDTKGLAIYEGHVLITQGSIRIDAEKVTLNYTKKQDIDKVIAEGNPTRFKQTPDGGKEDIKARAMRMEYDALQNVLQLIQEAELQQAKDSFAGQHITYDTHSGIIRADKGNSKDGRITVIIQPRPKKDTKTKTVE